MKWFLNAVSMIFWKSTSGHTGSSKSAPAAYISYAPRDRFEANLIHVFIAICAAERADSFQGLDLPSLPGRRTGQRDNTPCRLIVVKRIFGVSSVGNSDHKSGETRYVSFSSFSSMTAVSMRNVGSGCTRTKS